MTALLSLEETSALIAAGDRLLLAGDETVLRRLPRGKWVAGTSPYFMTDQGRVTSTDHISVCRLPPSVTDVTVKFYDANEIRRIATEAPDRGFTFLIIPSSSPVLPEFARNVPDYPEIYNTPLFGWVSGVAVEKRGIDTAKVVNGRTGEFSSDKALALHASLADGTVAEIGHINLFTQGNGETITVEKTADTFETVLVNGKPTNLAEYLKQTNADLHRPLVANYCGAMINVSFKTVDAERGLTKLYAPLFPNVEYRLAAPVDDYDSALERELHKIPPGPVIIISCILNCLYSQVQTTSRIPSLISFGEIAYGLLNQTLVYMALSDR